jgi:predicted dehydrogenase
MKSVVIGTGTIAQEHLACLSQLEDVHVVGVCDLAAVSAEAAASRFNVPRWFTNHLQLLDETRPDVVHVTTPPPTHYDLAVDAIDHGCHAIVEKPITIGAEQLADLCRRARAAQRFLIEDQNYLYNSTFQALLRHVDDGRLGRVVHAEIVLCLDLGGAGGRVDDPNLPHPSHGLPGGVAGDFLTHLASLAFVLAGPHRSVHVVTNPEVAGGGTAPRNLHAFVTAEHATATLLFNCDARPDTFHVRVHGTKMRAEAHLFEPRLIVERPRGGPRPLTPLINGLGAARGAVGGALGGLRQKLAPGPTGGYEGLWELLRRTYKALRDGDDPPICMGQIEQVHRLVMDLVK